MIYRKLIKLFIVFFYLSSAFAMDLELTQGINAQLPLGIQSFGESLDAKQLKEIVQNDLHFSGQFKFLNLKTKNTDKIHVINAWRQIGADSVLSGHVNQIDKDKFDVRYELTDITTGGRLLAGKSFQVSKGALRNLAHHISDEVYHKLTGERGIFSTKIAYILVERSKDKARYSLTVSDFDGYAPHKLLVSSEPLMSPTWSPNGKEIAYVSFEKKRSQVYIISVETGKRKLVTSFHGINGAPAFSPNGRELTVVLSKSGTPKLYQINLSNGAMKQLTYGESIDTEPFYAADGKSILFTSNRGGTPQIYRYSLLNGKINRVTYVGNYNARASLTPNQKQIVILHRDQNTFNIGIQNLQTGDVLPITFSSKDESPCIAPNGRMVLYATSIKNYSTLAVVSIDGKVQRTLPIRGGEVQSPAWSPFIG